MLVGDGEDDDDSISPCGEWGVVFYMVSYCMRFSIKLGTNSNNY